MRSNPALLLSYPYINGGGGLGARWLASPHISRLLKVDGFTWAPRTDSGDDVAERVDGFDSTHRMAGPAWVMHGIWAPPSRWTCPARARRESTAPTEGPARGPAGGQGGVAPDDCHPTWLPSLLHVTLHRPCAKTLLGCIA